MILRDPHGIARNLANPGQSCRIPGQSTIIRRMANCPGTQPSLEVKARLLVWGTGFDLPGVRGSLAKSFWYHALAHVTRSPIASVSVTGMRRGSSRECELVPQSDDTAAMLETETTVSRTNAALRRARMRLIAGRLRHGHQVGEAAPATSGQATGCQVVEFRILCFGQVDATRVQQALRRTNLARVRNFARGLLDDRASNSSANASDLSLNSSTAATVAVDMTENFTSLVVSDQPDVIPTRKWDGSLHAIWKQPDKGPPESVPPEPHKATYDMLLASIEVTFALPRENATGASNASDGSNTTGSNASSKASSLERFFQ